MAARGERGLKERWPLRRPRDRSEELLYSSSSMVAKEEEPRFGSREQEAPRGREAPSLQARLPQPPWVASSIYKNAKGWFSLSKSRYAMGNKSVSPLQYGHQMTPMVQVKTRKKDNGQMGFHVVSEDVKAAKPTATDAAEEIGPSEQVLRWRKGPGKAQAPAQPPKAFRKAAEGSGHQNPLTWFGILVPQSLRQAQRTFQEGIQLAAEIASLQSDIETTQRHYHALLGEKHKLVAREKQRCP
ncbi:vacuolar ATPase assembly protein VMA22 isoform X2 [Podarcis muralis]